MKILHVFKDFYPPLAAGITRYIADVSDGMADRGHQVQVHVAGVRQSRMDRLPSGVEVHRHREWFRALSMPLAPGLVRQIRTLEADIFHLHFPNPIGELGVALNARAQMVCSFHAQLGRQRGLEPLYAPLRNKLFDRAHSILVSGTAMASSSELRGHRAKVKVLPYGVSPRLAATVTTAPKPVGGPLDLLFVGRLVYYKGVDILLRAIATVPDVRLRIVGEGSDREMLEALAIQLGVADRAEFPGFLSDEELLNEFAAADVFVLPSVSRAEAFGMAMTEAMANGLPLISTSLGTGTDWVNVDGVTGVVVSPGDVSALASAIERMRDARLRSAFSREARQRASSLFSFHHHLDALEVAYQDAAG